MNVEICQLPPNKEGNITNKGHIDEDDLMKVELTDVCGELVNVNELDVDKYDEETQEETTPKLHERKKRNSFMNAFDLVRVAPLSNIAPRS
ncbi:hypothetical protein T03_9396 [Trichinella britovi]|uniref:PiggyBac transposable element-derived protein domain-containing protein n=1 Tax=Trichinella britovi TaxID=45882 RepID=A0A0V1DFR8_TRIBR|nr:hypothetical protein T03_9396 [Trichinella britovi]